MNLTIAYITSRKEPKIEWFADSLRNRIRDSGQLSDEWPTIIIVDSMANSERENEFGDHLDWLTGGIEWDYVLPKPTIWQGEHRITKEDWWAKSNAMNTAIILCKTKFIAFVDDRCVLGPMWLQSVRDAMGGEYAVCGSYEKRKGMKVENGEIKDWGTLLGKDDRIAYGHPVPTRDWYGGSGALPLEWCLKVNGFSEDMCDGLGSEDSMFGVTLRNAGFPMKYDSRMLLIEDRTPNEIEGALKRADKNTHLGTKAKSWDIVRAFYNKDTSGNSYDIRQHRNRVQNGEDLQSILPSASHYDWYDGQPIAEME